MLKHKPTFKELLLGTALVMSLIGLFVHGFVDDKSLELFRDMAFFVVGTVIGHFPPGQK